MPELDGQFGERIATLERQVESLSSSADRNGATIAGSKAAQQIRMAKTWSDDPLTYPGTGNTFEILFQDISVALPTTAGSRTVTRTNRSTLVLDLATTIDGAYIPRGNYVAVTYKNGHWWILGSVKEGEGFVGFKEYDVTFGNGHEVGGDDVHPNSVDNIQEAGDVGVTWDYVAKNWVVTRAGVMTAYMTVQLTPESPLGYRDGTFVLPFTPDDPPGFEFINDRVEKITHLGVIIANQGVSASHKRSNFTRGSMIAYDEFFVTCLVKDAVLIGDRIRVNMRSDEFWNGDSKRTPSDVLDDQITSARMVFVRLNDEPLAVAVAGPTSSDRITEDDLNRRISELGLVRIMEPDAALGYYRLDESDNRRIAENDDGRIAEAWPM